MRISDWSSDVCSSDLVLSVKLDQILEDQAAPAIRVRLHKQATFRKPAKFDRRESEISRKRRNLLAGSVIVARQEHDPLAAMDGRILVEDGSGQVVEALDQPAAGEGPSNDMRSEEHTSELQSLMRIPY